jgi:heparan-alpha-glucosaminide N-acetyltransferase
MSSVAHHDKVKAQVSEPEPRRSAASTSLLKGRYLSLDAYRGLIMILLVSSGFGFGALETHPVFGVVASQLDHVPWEGAVLWDLVMPAFVLMVGVAMPFAFSRRIEQGATFRQNLLHVAGRSLKLLALAHLFTIVHQGRFQFALLNVLTQIALTYFFCFLIMQLAFRWQVVTASLILLGYWVLFAIFPGPAGPFSQTGNIGQVIDQAVLGRTYPGGYVSINFITTTVSVLFGVWVGYLMISRRPAGQKIRILLVAAGAGLLGGLALSPFHPIVKRIWTVSFTLYSTGWVLLFLVAFVWLIEVKGYRRFAFPLMVVGMNSIFAYVVFQLFRRSIDRAVGVLTGRFEFVGTLAPVAQSCATLLVIWYFCYWLYQRKIFFKV